MRILLVSNHETERCGVAQWGRHCYEAARVAGVEVMQVDATYPRVLPDGADSFDGIFVNWHGATLGHLTPDDFPARVPMTLFLHEPDSVTPLLDRAAVVLSTEEPGSAFRGDFLLFPHPCLPYRPITPWSASEYGWQIGNSGLRHDGLEWVAITIANQNMGLLVTDGVPDVGEVNPNAWSLSQSSRDPDGWLSDEAELERLAGCALNIYHYHTGNSGQSYGVMMGVAAGRPLLLNRNRMLANLWADGAWAEEIYLEDDPGVGIETVIRDIRDGREKRPWKLRAERSWDKRVEVLVELWGALSGGKAWARWLR